MKVLPVPGFSMRSFQGAMEAGLVVHGVEGLDYELDTRCGLLRVLRSHAGPLVVSYPFRSPHPLKV